jgi:hypothetical protein
MTRRTYSTTAMQLLLIALIAVTPSFAQGPPGGRGMMMGDGSNSADMQLFHQLFEHRTEITRQVIARADGIETVTESKNPEVTRLLKTHVTSMLARVKDGRPIHQRDPLFVELFKNADQIAARYEPTASGVRVIETSKDAYVVKLLHAHAEVVSAFLANGMSEMMKNHPAPPR